MNNLIINIKNWLWTAKDESFNVSLNIYNWVLYNILQIKEKHYIPSKKYQISYFDDFISLSIDDVNSKYLLSQPWGNYHPADLQQWYD